MAMGKFFTEFYQRLKLQGQYKVRPSGALSGVIEHDDGPAIEEGIAEFVYVRGDEVVLEVVFPDYEEGVQRVNFRDSKGRLLGRFIRED